MRKIFLSIVLATTVASMSAQKSKVQAAWRSLSDYEETLKEGKPEISYLNKASESIDQALANEDTKNQAKAHAYKLRISYARFQHQLSGEIKKLEPTMNDKSERLLAAYGNTSLSDFETAASELNKIKELDPKFLETIQEGLKNGSGGLDEDELKFALAVQQMKIEAANIASGKYKVKKYDEASDYFYRTAVMNSILYKTMDTANFYNACISAAKAKNNEKIATYNNKMIDAKIAIPYNYEALYNVNIEQKDSSAAMETLKKGRQLFPNDASLLTQETNFFLAKGKKQEALNNLKLSVEKEPNNALYYFIIGNIYDNMANPKDPVTKKEVQRPTDFTELFANAEKNYMKAIELKPVNQDYLYNALYNLGAMYNNYGGSLAASQTGKVNDVAKKQKDGEAQAETYYKKAIPYLERALTIKQDDKATMSALRKLYMLTGDEVKAKEMNARIKGSE